MTRMEVCRAYLEGLTYTEVWNIGDQLDSLPAKDELIDRMLMSCDIDVIESVIPEPGAITGVRLHKAISTFIAVILITCVLLFIVAVLLDIPFTEGAATGL